MRQIKYRAWHIERKKMYTVDYLEWKPKHPEAAVGLLESDDYASFDEVILMQSTGVMDKNGKEIFEDDILNVYTGGQGHKPHKERVEFFNGCFSPWGCCECTAPYTTTGYSITGNIHENPEMWEL